MAKYNVGDKVKIRSDLQVDKFYGEDSFVTGMRDFIGKEVSIRDVCDGYTGRYLIEGCHYGFTDEMIECKVEDPKFKVGDKVKLKKGLVKGRMYKGLEFFELMKQFKGCVGTVIHISPSGYFEVDFGKLDRFYYSEPMLEKYEEEVKDEIMEQYKLGDKVMIKNGLIVGEKYNEITMIDGMTRYEGKVGVIVEEANTTAPLVGFEDGNSYYFGVSMIEKVNELKTKTETDNHSNYTDEDVEHICKKYFEYDPKTGKLASILNSRFGISYKDLMFAVMESGK